MKSDNIQDFNFDFPLLMIASVGVMVVLVLLILLFFAYSRRKIMQEKLQASELRDKHQMDLIENAIQVEERARNRIARELHDDLGSKLGLLSINMQLFRQENINDENQKQGLIKMEEILENSINTTRRISHELLPPVLDSFGLQAALEDLMIKVNTSTSLNLNISNVELLKFASTNDDLNLYRIVQELVNNTLKHSKASKAEFRIRRENEGLCVDYWDNGVGLNKEHLENSGGLGFKNIKSRTLMLKGDFELPATNKGFFITLKFPNYGK